MTITTITKKKNNLQKRYKTRFIKINKKALKNTSKRRIKEYSRKGINEKR